MAGRKKKGDEPEATDGKTDLLEGAGPGVGPQEKIPQIEKAARKYVEVRDERMAMTKKEVDARAVLANAMHENKVEVYRFGDLEVVCKPGKETIKVKQVDEDDESQFEE